MNDLEKQCKEINTLLEKIRFVILTKKKKLSINDLRIQLNTGAIIIPYSVEPGNTGPLQLDAKYIASLKAHSKHETIGIALDQEMLDSLLAALRNLANNHQLS